MNKDKSKSKDKDDRCIVGELKEYFDVAKSEYTNVFKKLDRLDAIDNGDLWKAVAARFPNYQILPDTNHVTRTKDNIVASVYTVGKSASLLATSEHDKDIVAHINLAIDYIWDEINAHMFQLQAGERAALLNLGVTQVGWDNSKEVGSVNNDNYSKGCCVLKNVDPMKYMRDPYSSSLDDAHYVITWDEYHKSAIQQDPKFKDAFKTLKEEGKLGDNSTETAKTSTDRISKDASSRKDYYKIYSYWVKEDGGVTETHLLNNAHVLSRKENIKPAQFPFAELYCNIPSEGNLVGSSPCAKMYRNTVAYNLMNSIMLTSEYKNQRPPRFVSTNSGINIPTFTKHGNDADRTFVVQGDARQAVQYHQFPTPSPQILSAMATLANDIKDISGIDDRYTGRDTGSILTTGGIESMLDQVTLIDATRVLLYEEYTKRLTMLVMGNYINNSTLSRKYLVSDGVKNGRDVYKEVVVDFPDIPDDIMFNYSIMISSDLPKNKARLESVANMLMEKQMQYAGAGTEVDLITPQEWLAMIDIPNKEQMLDRMGIQRTNNYIELVAQAVSTYGGLLEQGQSPEDAINMTAESMAMDGQPGAEEDIAAQMGMMGMGQPGLTDMM